MAEQEKCPVRRPMDCEGTTSCPPRCPRYVAPDGTAYTIYRTEEFPGELPELESFEVNPLVATPSGVSAVDFHTTLATDASAAAGVYDREESGE